MARKSAGALHFFPVRHHSPACAWQLARLLHEVQPAAVLVEGPKDFNPQIRSLLDERTVPPVALYTSFADRGDALGLGKTGGPMGGPHRFAAFYPFCASSPELVALRVGHQLGARLRFIDLPYPQQTMASRSMLDGRDQTRVASLLSEVHFRQSRNLAELARRFDCRDHDDLWDHLFEQRAPHLEPKVFAEEVTAYCALTRADLEPELLEADGTRDREPHMAKEIRAEQRRLTAREHHMAKEIRAEQRRGGPLVVVTGGFHTVVLPDLVEKLPRRSPVKIEVDDEDRCTVLVRYSFDQLDALNGYSAGMQSPEYYDRVWQGLDSDPDDALLRAATDTIVEIGRLTRDRDMPVRLSVADEIAALAQARGMARFRDHTGPTREDVLDAMRSCFVKGAMESEGAMLMQTVRTVLAGDRIGVVPPDTPAPPIVDDFNRQCRQLKLALDDSTPKNRHLHLYRSARHRRISQFFHRCQFLDVPLAQMRAGPDFVRGFGLDLLREQWSYAWRPGIEARLIELAVRGSTISEAAVSMLGEHSRRLSEEGQGRSARAGVELLLEACRMGLHEVAVELLAGVAVTLGEDPDFAEVVASVGQLALLHEARAPLEGERLQDLPAILRAGYERGCTLLDDCARLPDDRVAEVLDGISRLRELIRGDLTALSLDPDLLLDTAGRLAARADATPAVAGAAIGVLFGEGRIDARALVQAVDGFLRSTPAGGSGRAGYLRGLLLTCRQTLWQVPGLIERLELILEEWSEQEFLDSLPEMRLGFSTLTPREVERVADSVADMYSAEGRDGDGLGDLVHHDVDEAEMLLGVRITAAVRAQLERDGLGAWLETGG